jgi:iron complex transport system substrate-binding protein
MLSIRMPSAIPRARGVAITAVALVTILAVTGCAPTATDAHTATSATSQVEQGAFPVTIEHALGKTTITEEPKRVLVMDSESADTVLALGVVPTSIVKQSWGGDKDGYFPWTREAIDELVDVAPKTQVFSSDTGELDFEVILEQEPDVILAPYSGFSTEEYERLSEIAPTVPYDYKPWQPSSWQATTTNIGKALGRPALAAKLIGDVEGALEQTRVDHPEFEGVSFIYGTYLREGETQTAVYGPEDPRVKFFESLGLTIAPDVIAAADAAGDDGSFTIGVSLEKLNTIDADIYLGWASEQSEVDYTLGNALFSDWRVIAAGKDLWITDKALSSAAQRASVLSIPWAIGETTSDLTELIERP